MVIPKEYRYFAYKLKTKQAIDTADSIFGEDCFDPLEEAVRFQVRAFIEAMLEEEV